MFVKRVSDYVSDIPSARSRAVWAAVGIGCLAAPSHGFAEQILRIQFGGWINCQPLDTGSQLTVWEATYQYHPAYYDTGTGTATPGPHVLIWRTGGSGIQVVYRLIGPNGYSQQTNPTSASYWFFGNTPLQPGNYTAYVDNHSIPFSIAERAPQPPDLIVTSVVPQSADPYSVGQAVRWDCVVRNDGASAAPSSRVCYYLGASPTDLSYQWQDDGAGILAAGGSSSESETYTFLAADVGVRYLICKADCEEDVVECGPNGESNNSTVYGPFTVSSGCQAPSITQQPGPAAADACQGGVHQFCVSAAGTAPLAYQWQRNGVDIAGATGNCHAASQVGAYRCAVSNACGGPIYSDVATLTLWPAGSGDVNGDDALDGRDAAAFVLALMQTPSGPLSKSFCAADADGNGVLNQDDLAAFVAVLLAG